MKGPPLIEATESHQCGSFINIRTNDTWLVVASPSPSGSRIQFQFLNFHQDPQRWIEGINCTLCHERVD